MYYFAEQCRAYYDAEGQKTTIWYDNDNLRFSLLFERKMDAQDFQNYLAKAVRHHSYALEFDEIIQTLHLETELTSRIFSKHYQTEEETSPPSHSLVDLISNRSGTSVADNDEGSKRSLQALENLSKLKPHLKLYCCHLASKKSYSVFASDPDNLVYTSWEFHAYLDGLNTEISNFPYLALEYDEEKNVVDILEDVLVEEVFSKRFKVWVNIHFWDVDTANVVSLTLKDGSYEIERPGGTSIWCSYLHFRNKNNAKIYIDIKFNETMMKWSERRK
jgi:hypothetical protein